MADLTLSDDFFIRNATTKDVAEILNIYKYYVENTAISFEYETPDVEDFSSRIKNTLAEFPYLVAVYQNKIVGYAYAGKFIPRKAYDKCAELTIYIDKSYTKSGIGRKLYTELENQLKNKGFLNLYACIAYPDKTDEYLDFNSIEFHGYVGFEIVGKFKKCGYKFNRWYNMAWLEKIIGEH